MNRTTLLVAAAVAVLTLSSAHAQTYPRHRHFPSQTVSHPAIQHSVVQRGVLHHGKGDCGCGPVATPGCTSCCPPIIPCLLNKLDRLVHCLLPSCRIGCGGGACGGGAKFGGCCNDGVVMDHGVIMESQKMQPQPAAEQTYYQRRGTLTPRYQPARSRTVPTPVRRTAAPRTTAKPVTPRTRVASTELKKIDEGKVQLQPAPGGNVRVASFNQQATAKAAAAKKSRVRNPLRD